MSKLPPHMIKRMIFMFCVMFPVLLYAEYTGRNSVIVAAVTGGVASGVSVVLFPDPAHLRSLKDKDNDQ
ncbi:MAG TPA: hypothetical protein PLR50_10530 [Candidatus Rifleibacterium sp.]|jgi:predicted branched-subunit amino acid permease|nr:hypothetical protein [Candidatus Rifleibacterium sp.]HPW57505.1 hypothetical protein [Candidatus Rifleibacterium sp.]HQB83922.1 hypothetical protein [Candidatus Rifleibacterium sp.]